MQVLVFNQARRSSYPFLSCSFERRESETCDSQKNARKSNLGVHEKRTCGQNDRKVRLSWQLARCRARAAQHRRLGADQPFS